MHAGALGGFDDGFVGCVFAHAGDVLFDGAVEQLDALRQIADMLAGILARPVIEVGAIEADGAMLRHVDADHGFGEGGFASGRRADDAKAFAGLQGERNAAQDGAGFADADIEVVDRQQAARGGQGGFAAWLADMGDQQVQAAIGIARGDEALPHLNGSLEGRKGTGSEQRTGDNAARSDFIMHSQVSAGAGDAHLQHHAQGAGAAGDDGAALLRGVLQGEAAGGILLPLGDDIGSHAHGLDGFAGAAQRIGRLVGFHGALTGAHQRLAGGIFIDERRSGEHDDAAGGDEAQQRVDHVDHQQENERPGHIHQRRRGAGDVAFDGHQVALVLAGHGGARLRREDDGNAQQTRRYGALQPLHHPGDNGGADGVEAAVEQVADEDDSGERHQRFQRTAGEHTVEHLQRIDRHQQRQQVDGEGKHESEAQRPLHGDEGAGDQRGSFGWCGACHASGNYA